MEALTIVLQFSLLILVMGNGLAMIVGGPRMMGRFNRWVGRSVWRVFCRLVGGFFSSLGRTISRWGR